ncbi:thiol-disulfide oxidoreductase ResA [Halobacillus litoralis]|uniref:thiol-disulfide oxidoreductase ResA n=1 Tax=Halobacillus litoralis TaxID=45668 RepID=UPI002491DA29|nr:thiol-disulfide oxidoreductase ResA [Halobacillus litoralis]
MEKKRKRLIMRSTILSIFLLLVGFTLYQNFNSKTENIQPGDQAPNFRLKTLNGKTTMELKDFRGQGVFLNVWATYCKPCEEEMPYIENQYHKFKDKGVQVLTVDVGENPVTVQAFVDRIGMTFPVLMDPREELLDAYGIGPIPVTFLIDENGKVVDRITAGMTEEEIRGYMQQIQPDDWRDQND